MLYYKTLFFRRILISRFPDVENSLHFNFADFPVNFITQICFLFLLVLQTNVIEIHPILLFALYNNKNIAYHIIEEFIFYADKIMVMGDSKNSCVFKQIAKI